MAALAYLLLLRGHDRATIAPTDVQSAPRRSQRMVAIYACVIAVFGVAYLVA